MVTTPSPERDIRTKLSNYNLSQTWLITQLSRRGIIVDSARLSKVLHCSVRGEGVNRILETSLDILKQYEEFYGE